MPEGLESTVDNQNGQTPLGSTQGQSLRATLSNQDGQPAPKADGEQAGTTDNLIAGKFKTQDDLVKAYQEMERFKGQKSQYEELGRQFVSTAQTHGLSPEEAFSRLSVKEKKAVTEELDGMDEYETRKFFDEFAKNPKKAMREIILNHVKEFAGSDEGRKLFTSPIEEHEKEESLKREVEEVKAKYKEISDPNSPLAQGVMELLEATGYKMSITKAAEVVSEKLELSSLRERIKQLEQNNGGGGTGVTPVAEPSDEELRKKAQSLTSGGIGSAKSSKMDSTFQSAVQRAKDAMASKS